MLSEGRYISQTCDFSHLEEHNLSYLAARERLKIIEGDQMYEVTNTT